MIGSVLTALAIFLSCWYCMHVLDETGVRPSDDDDGDL